MEFNIIEAAEEKIKLSEIELDKYIIMRNKLQSSEKINSFNLNKINELIDKQEKRLNEWKSAINRIKLERTNSSPPSYEEAINK